MNRIMINVTKTYLPPLEDYIEYLKEIWSNGWLTNNGNFVQKLESELLKYLNIENLVAVSNGTIALQIALEALDVKGEVITTPFSYVATVNSIIWQKCKPVFVDIDENTLCINPELIENAITDKTQAIMPVHVFGIPCDVKAIDNIAKKHNLKVIYDAAHAFGVKINGESVLNFGEISTLSFHATKLFHTGEGGAIISNSKELNDKIWLMKKFGHIADEYFLNGINAKITEMQAALGLCVLKNIDNIINHRKLLFQEYDKYLRNTELKFPTISSNIEYNYSYYPVIFPDERKLLNCLEELKKNDIYPRRYFYPSLNTLPYINANVCPVSEDIAKRIMCLPLSHESKKNEIEQISKTILDCFE